eukprot:gene25675-biopygen2283
MKLDDNGRAELLVVVIKPWRWAIPEHNMYGTQGGVASEASSTCSAPLSQNGQDISAHVREFPLGLAIYPVSKLTLGRPRHPTHISVLPDGPQESPLRTHGRTRRSDNHGIL